MSPHISNERPQPDKVLTDIADYVLNYQIKNELAWETAHYCLLDTIGCGLEALTYPACAKLLGPVVKVLLFPMGQRYLEHNSSLILFRLHSILARLFAGWILTIPGWLPNGVILPITWAAFSLLQTGYPVLILQKVKRRSR